MTTITRDQAHALAALLATLRPDWQPPGILKALSDARERADAWSLAHAALHAAQDPKVRTPAVIALAGEHWTKGKALGTGDPLHFARCPEDGHSSYPASSCGACKADRIATTAPRSPEPRGVPMPDTVRAVIRRPHEANTEQQPAAPGGCPSA